MMPVYVVKILHSGDRFQKHEFLVTEDTRLRTDGRLKPRGKSRFSKLSGRILLDGAWNLYSSIERIKIINSHSINKTL